jgi:predicted ATPase/DNA-binding SARP family transcriptional activator
MRVQILGPLEVIDREGRELGLGGPKQRAVLAILLLRANEVVARERLIDELWGESPPRSAANTLQVYISNLRKALGEGVLVTRPGGYRLDRDLIELDADEFSTLVADGERALQAGDPGSAHRLLVRALGLWRGQPLSEFAYAEFAQGEIARLEEARIAASEERIEALLGMGGDAALVGELEALIREHPLRERLHGQLMLALYRSGRQADALEAYRLARDRLVDELGLEPHEELQALQTAILNHDPSLTLSRRRSADAERGALPRRHRRLIGRDRELQELEELLADPDVALVTLTGTGGTGKTALVLEAARRGAPSFPDGVAVIWLASIVDEQQVLGEFARVLGITPSPDEPLLEALIRILREQERLLVVDNFEHLLPAAPAVAALAEGCPRLKLLVTSRGPLRVSAERIYPVAALAVPDSGAEAVREWPSAVLFLERAAAGDSGYELAEDDERALGELCRYLGGIPLALELAAARASVLAPAAILERLQHSSDDLGPAPRDAPERQRSLRATIEWSTNLIEPNERALLARLSVFNGGFTAEAAEAVCGGLELSITDGLTTLLDQGLIHRSPAHHGTRLAMLEPIRDYARGRLSKDPEHDAVVRAFAEHYATFAENAAAGFASPMQLHWTERLDDEQANMRAVMYRARSSEELEVGLRIAGSLYDYWQARPLAIDFFGWLEPTLAHHRGEPSARVKALYLLGVRLAQTADLERAEVALSECLSLAQQLGNRRFEVLSEARLAELLYQLGSVEQAVRHRDHAREALGGELDRLTRAAVEDRLLWRETSDPGEVREALEAYLAASEAAGDNMRISSIGLSLGAEAMLRGDYAEARTRLERALAAAELVRWELFLPPIQATLGEVALYEGQIEEARERLTDAARGATRLREFRALQEVLIGLAAVAAGDGDEHRAARLLAVARTVWDGAMSREAEDLLEHFLSDVPTVPAEPAFAPGAPIGTRELDAILADGSKRVPRVS